MNKRNQKLPKLYFWTERKRRIFEVHIICVLILLRYIEHLGNQHPDILASSNVDSSMTPGVIWFLPHVIQVVRRRFTGAGFDAICLLSEQWRHVKCTMAASSFVHTITKSMCRMMVFWYTLNLLQQYNSRCRTFYVRTFLYHVCQAHAYTIWHFDTFFRTCATWVSVFLNLLIKFTC